MTGRAEICRRTIQGDQGSGIQYFVRTPDGYLLECGASSKRAEAVCDSINFAKVPWPVMSQH